MINAQKNYRDKLNDHSAHAPESAAGHDFGTKFICPEESMRYSGALEQMVFNRLQNGASRTNVIEFGSGTGDPVISAMINSAFSGTVMDTKSIPGR